MPQLIRDRVRETSTTTGTVTFVLGGAVTGFRTWSGAGFANNDTGYYLIEHQSANEWEIGLGTWTTGGNLARTTPLVGSAATPVNFTAGTKHVVLIDPASANESIANLATYTAPNGRIDWLVLFDTTAGQTKKVAPDKLPINLGRVIMAYRGFNLP